MMEEEVEFEAPSKRPQTIPTVFSDEISIRSSVAAAYLDLRPLPEDVTYDNLTSGDWSVDKSVDLSVDRSAKSWKEEEEEIRRRLHERLPSTRSLGSTRSIGSDNGLLSTNQSRPSTAPVRTITQQKSRENLVAASTASVRNARYLAIQWRSRATQLNLSKTMPDSMKESAPSPMRVSDGSESDSEASDSSGSDVSDDTMDESIKSQVSDAQRVVEKWQQRWNERGDSGSFCSATASRDEEDEREREATSGNSAETLKMRGSKVREEYDPEELGFALKPPDIESSLITSKNDPLQITSALKPYPLQPVDSGQEFFSESQKLLSQFIDNGSDSEEDDTPVVEKRGVLILAEGGKVMETVTESAGVQQAQEDTNERTASSIDSVEDLLSRSAGTSRAGGDFDDHLSESSSTIHSLDPIKIEPQTKEESFRSSNKSIVHTFCRPAESFTQEESSSSLDRIIGEQQDVSDEATINTKESSVVSYTGSVQERIEAVKRSKAVNESRRPSSRKSKKRSPRSGAATKRNSESMQQSKPLKWEEHNVIFTFGLLTSEDDAPPTGAYPSEDDELLPYREKLKTKSKLTHGILSNFANIIRRTKSLGNGSTRYMMISPDCTPRPVSVHRDGKWNLQYKAPANRPSILRSIIKASVPIFVPKDDMQAKEVATHVVLDLFAVAISKGDFSGLRFEKIL